jgi:hypothetical protein
MLRDIEESRRVNTQVVNAIKASKPAASNKPAKPVADCAIISDNYWPPVASKDGDETSGMAHHPAASALITQYLDTYGTLKAARKLHVQNHLGSVQLELQFEDGSERSFNVDPIQVHMLVTLNFGLLLEWI